MEIRVKISKSALKDPAALKRLENPLAIAKAMAEQLEDRVRRKGQTATAPKPYATVVHRRIKVTTKAGQTYEATRRVKGAGQQSRGTYRVSPEYAAAATGTLKTRFKSSADFHQHAGTKLGTYDTTSGMWNGLQIRNFGTTGSLIEFGGSSLGSSSTRSANTRVTDKSTWVVMVDRNGKAKARRKRELSKGEDGKTTYRTKARRVENWRKAGTVFKHSHVGLLQPTDRELADVADALMDRMAITTATLFGAKVERLSSRQKGDLYRRITKEFGV